MPSNQATLAQLPINPLFVHTPESLVENAAGKVQQWNDVSGNGSHATGGNQVISNNNSVKGIRFIGNTFQQATITTDPNNYTVAYLVQRVSTPSVYFDAFYFNNNGYTDSIRISSNVYIALAGYTTVTPANPSANIGGFLFFIVRYSSQTAATYFINNIAGAGSLSKTSSPNKTPGNYTIYTPNNNTDSPSHIINFRGMWNRSLTDAECLQISQYAFKLSGGQVGDNPNQLRKYKNISLPTGSLFLHTPDSIQTNPAGQVLQWNDVSGNNRHSIVSTGAPKIFNQNGIQGLAPTVAASVITKTISLNPKIITFVKLWQKSVNVSVGAQTPTVFQMSNGTNNNYIYTSASQIGCIMAGFSGAPGSIQAVNVDPGKYSLIILRYDIDNSICNFYINNTVTNISLAKQTTPSITTDNYVFYDSAGAQSQHGIVNNFSAAWNKYLTDAECLAVSNYAYVLTNGQIGDKPKNTAQISKLQADLGAI